MTATRRGILAAALALACAGAACAADVVPSCRRGGDAAQADYQLTFRPRPGPRTPAQEDELDRRLQRGVANECFDAARTLAELRGEQRAALPPDAEPARRKVLDAEILSLANEAARVDGNWFPLALERMTPGSGNYDLAAGVAALEKCGAHGDADCMPVLVGLYTAGLPPDVAPDPARAAYWSDRLKSLRR